MDKLSKANFQSTTQKEELSNTTLNSKKGHLISIMPELVECIESKDIEVRDMTKEILSQISKMLLKK